MVTQLDPDAPTRQLRPIHDLDQVYANLFLFNLFIINVKLLVLILSYSTSMMLPQRFLNVTE